jgi:hypothetical protein
MRKFISQLILFTMPILVLGLLTEFLLRKIPNDYVSKKEYLDKNSDDIKILFLGNSHAFYGVNPEFVSLKSFNASHISQSLDFDYEILKKYKNHWSSLKYIVIPISYFSLFSRLETGIESWRVKNYTIYYGINSTTDYFNYSEVLSNKIALNFNRLNAYYLDGNSGITCSNLGWGLNYSSKDSRDLKETGISAAKRHYMYNDMTFNWNANIIKSIIEFANVRNVKILFYSPPAYFTYSEILDHKQLNETFKYMSSVDAKYENVKYHNFLYDSTFIATDFFDADHLNEIGAKKFTLKINTLINSAK